MKSAKELLENWSVKKTNINSERASLVALFVQSYNDSCEKKWHKTSKEMAIKISHVSTGDLQWLYDLCCHSKNFGKKLNWSLKIRKGKYPYTPL
jgi:hypothetical protein